MSLNDLYTFWFSNQHLWFNATPNDDDNIKTLFSPLLNNPPELSEVVSVKDKVSYVILFDQIPRHTDRGNYNIINKYLNYN